MFKFSLKSFNSLVMLAYYLEKKYYAVQSTKCYTSHNALPCIDSYHCTQWYTMVSITIYPHTITMVISARW